MMITCRFVSRITESFSAYLVIDCNRYVFVIFFSLAGWSMSKQLNPFVQTLNIQGQAQSMCQHAL